MRFFRWSAALMLCSPAVAQAGDELAPLPAAALIGKPYAGAGAAAEIFFINARSAPVRLFWIRFDGTLQLYAVIQPGGEVRQPTYVSHRWLITRHDVDAPIQAFIATRSDIHGDGQSQVAVIR